MATVTVVAVGDGQIRISADVRGEETMMLLAQALEMVRVQVVAKAVADLPPSVTIESALPGSLNGGSHGLRGGDANFRIGRSGG